MHVGLVHANGRNFADDTGVWHPLGATCFPLVHVLKHEPERTAENLEYLANQGIEFVRILGEVGGASWADRVIDPHAASYEADLGAAIDTAWSYGLRTMLTIFGGGTDADPDRTLHKVIDVINSRRERLLCVEIANESDNGPPHDVQRRHARQIRERFPDLLVTLHSGDTAEKAKLDLDVVNCLTIHLDRHPDVKDWRTVVQSWGLDWPHVPGISGEPIGPQSSGASMDDPLRQAALRTVGVFNGLTAFVFHPGAGIRLGGEWDRGTKSGQLRMLPANYADTPRFAEIVSALRASTARLPLDVPNWAKTSQSQRVPRPDNRYLYADSIWSDGFDHGVHRSYVGYNGNEFVCVPIGVLNWVEMVAVEPVRFTVYSMLDGAQVGDEVRLQAGGRHRLEGDGGANAAYVVTGSLV